MFTKARRVAAATGLAAALLTVAGGPALANSNDVERRGDCTTRSEWKLKLSEEDGALEVEFEVDEAAPGQVWNVDMSRNGAVFFRGQRTTDSTGEFEVRRVIADPAGPDRVVARATNTKTGEVCRGVATSDF